MIGIRSTSASGRCTTAPSSSSYRVLTLAVGLTIGAAAGVASNEPIVLDFPALLPFIVVFALYVPFLPFAVLAWIERGPARRRRRSRPRRPRRAVNAQRSSADRELVHNRLPLLRADRGMSRTDLADGPRDPLPDGRLPRARRVRPEPPSRAPDRPPLRAAGRSGLLARRRSARSAPTP